MAGENKGAFDVWYRRLDPNGSGTIQAVSAAGFLKKSGLNDNILSMVKVLTFD